MATLDDAWALGTADYIIPVALPQPRAEAGYWETMLKIQALKLASYLTEPICKVREYYYTFYILHVTCQTTVQKVAQTVYLALGIVICTLLTPFATPVGAAVRGGVSLVASRPYTYVERGEIGKRLPVDQQVTTWVHNECDMPGGYSITDGAVTPSDQTRMDANIAQAKALNPDVICLCEIVDICDAEYIASQLPDYPFVILAAGTGLGPSSMQFVASKYKMVNIDFLPYVRGTELTGRAQFAKKGILSFELQSEGEQRPFASVVMTHLQHSEVPAKPEEAERLARAAQMRKVIATIQEKETQGYPVFFVGDLNQDEAELSQSLGEHAARFRRDPAVQGVPTWGGDQWCAELMRKESSDPTVLDYAIAVGEVDISTQVINNGYSSSEFRPGHQALSDHMGLFSTYTLRGA